MRGKVNEFKGLLKKEINEGKHNKDICISLDIASENINKISCIAIIFYFDNGDNSTCWIRTRVGNYMTIKQTKN